MTSQITNKKGENKMKTIWLEPRIYTKEEIQKLINDCGDEPYELIGFKNLTSIIVEVKTT